MDPISRRRALALGALGAVGVVTGGVGLSRTGLPWAETDRDGPARATGSEMVEPEVVRSENGVLRVELIAARQRLKIAGRAAQAMTYNASLPGPTWHVQPGDRIEVRLVNQLEAATNLHTHGLVVSPEGNGDNPFVSIAPGQSFDYRFDLPTDHPTGVFWYHPHLHGTVADQVFAGLYGAIIVSSASEEVSVTRERILVVSDISVTDTGEIRPTSPPEIMMGREGEQVLVNGQALPRLSARAGQRERWLVVNACTSRYLNLAVPGQEARVLGIDAGHDPGPAEDSGVLLAPGNRADLLVTVSAGTSEVRSLGYDRGTPMMGMSRRFGELSGPVPLATVSVTGASNASPEPIPERPPERDLRGRDIAKRREITFTMAMGAMMRGPSRMQETMGFDGHPFDADRTDQQAIPGAVEEWTITNPTPMDHPFHLHVWPMQVIHEAGAPLERPTWRDVVNVPAHGQVRVLVEFAPHSGRTVYHCHILDHEDAGMMATVEVPPE